MGPFKFCVLAFIGLAAAAPAVIDFTDIVEGIDLEDADKLVLSRTLVSSMISLELDDNDLDFLKRSYKKMATNLGLIYTDLKQLNSNEYFNDLTRKVLLYNTTEASGFPKQFATHIESLLSSSPGQLNVHNLVNVTRNAMPNKELRDLFEKVLLQLTSLYEHIDAALKKVSKYEKELVSDVIRCFLKNYQQSLTPDPPSTTTSTTTSPKTTTKSTTDEATTISSSVKSITTTAPETTTSGAAEVRVVMWMLASAIFTRLLI